LPAAPQANADISQSPAGLHVATRLVQVGVIVRDKSGAVTNLTKEDFAVFDRGKAQTISFFSPEAASTAAPPEPAQPLPEGTLSNLPQYSSGAPASITIVLLDNLNALYGSYPTDQFEAAPFWIEDLALQNAKNHLIQFIERLKPRDLVALYSLTSSLHVLCDFTNDREQLLTIVKKYDTTPMTNRAVVEPGKKGAPVLNGEADGFENGAAASVAANANLQRAKETMEALEAIANHVANIPGRKNLVWLTANLPFSGEAMARMLSPANIAVYPMDARGLLTATEDTRPPSAGGPAGANAAGGVAFAATHLRNAPAQSSQPAGISTMQELAEETGGQAFVNTNDLTNALRKAIEDSNVTYTLGFYIDPDAADGKFHELKIELRVKGLIVRYPSGYFAYSNEPVTTNVNRNNVITAVRSPIESSAIPFTASFERVAQGTNNALKVNGRIELRNVRLVANGELREGAVDVDMFQQDATGKVLGNSSDRIHLRFTRAGYARALEQGLRFRKTIPLYPGTTTLRVLVQNPSTSELGSLIIPLSQIQ
jgi:VWFA-related protein